MIRVDYSVHLRPRIALRLAHRADATTAQAATARDENPNGMVITFNPIQRPAWLSGNVVGRVNEVALRRAGLVLRWATVRG